MNSIRGYSLFSILFLCNASFGSNNNNKISISSISRSDVQSALNNPEVLGIFGASRSIEENLIFKVLSTEAKANNNQINIKNLQDRVDSMASCQNLNNDYFNKKNDVQDKEIIHLQQRCFILEILYQNTALSIVDQAELLKKNKKLKRYIDQLEKKIKLKNRLFPSQKTTHTLRGIIASSKQNKDDTSLGLITALCS